MPKTATQAAAAETQEVQASPPLPIRYDVKIHSLRPEGTLKGTASVSLNDQFAIRSVKIMEGSKGLFVSMPSYKAGNGEYKDICFPCTKDAREQFDSAVLGAYRQALTQGQTAARMEAPDPFEGPEENSGQTMAM